jgi:hypothetical protein
MSIQSLSLTMKLDHAYEAGVIAFVSAKNLLVPIRERRDIHVDESAEMSVHYANAWIPVRSDQIKFCHRGRLS